MRRRHISIGLVFMLIAQLVSYFVVPTHGVKAEIKTVTLVGSLQSELGSSSDWDPSDSKTVMTNQGNGLYTFNGLIPAGTYEYKIAIDGTWDESYGKNGSRGGENIVLELSKETNVSFYFNANTHKIADSTNYTPIASEKIPRIVGNIQPSINQGGEWSPSESKAFLMDDDFDNVYTYITQVPAGNYEYKIILGDNWSSAEAFPGSNATLNVVSKQYYLFSYNASTNEVNAIVTTAPPTSSRIITLVGNFQKQLGNSSDWDPAGVTTMNQIADGLYAFTGKLLAGDYEYKVTINQTWDESYGTDGNNISLHLEHDTDVTFFYHDGTHKLTDSTKYNALPIEKTPRLVGDLQIPIGETENWSPSNSKLYLSDNNFDGIYEFTTNVPKGKYEFKIALGSNWDEAYPSSNTSLNVIDDSKITFFYNSLTKSVYSDYNPNGHDGLINKEMIYHDTWKAEYRQPFGAVSAGTPVTLRLSAKMGDLTRASAFVKNNLTSKTTIYKMNKVGTDELAGKQVEYWEVTFIPDSVGVYGYKFLVADGSSSAEYGESGSEGKDGIAVDKNAELFQLSVYDPAYKTPDWMKKAVVYQIFPDRFNNGNKKNDYAKKNARGPQLIEHQTDWNTLPDNPRIKDKNPTGYTGDGQYSNDFFGGDIVGIEQKLDYLQSLGVNTLYLNPIAMAPSNHKYDATDYKQIDPMFGSPNEFKSFVKSLEKRKMHLILDGVFNHSSDDSIYFDRYSKYKTVGAYEYWATIYDLMNAKGITQSEAEKQAIAKFKKEGQEFSPYGFQNWFTIENKKVVDPENKQEHYAYEGWWGYESLPVFKSINGTKVNHSSELNNEAFANYIFYDKNSVAKTWLNNGSTGWRLDVANEVDPEFWREFRKELKSFKGNDSSLSDDDHNKEKKMDDRDKGKKEDEDREEHPKTLEKDDEPLILGEIWDDASKYLLGDQFDSVMNYRFQRSIIDFLKNGKADQTVQSLTAIQEDYPKEAQYALMNLLGSHDTARSIFVLGNGSDSFERAEDDPNYSYSIGKARLKLASIIQMGYAGAPTIYYGDEAGLSGSKDPDDRRTYPWGKEDKDLVKHYQKIGKIRQDYQNLFSKGTLDNVYGKDDVYGFVRTNEDRAALIIINRSNEEKTVEIDINGLIPNGATLVDQLDSKYSAKVSNGKITVSIPPLSGRMAISNKLEKQWVSLSNLKVQEGSQSAVLNWKGNAKKYIVYQSKLNGALFHKVGEAKTNSFTATNLTNGQNYYFKVVAVDDLGNELGSVSTNVTTVPHYSLDQAVLTYKEVVKQGELDLASNHNVSAAILIPGITINQAEGVSARLAVKLDGVTQYYPAQFVEAKDGVNTFTSVFKSLRAGSYSYYMQFSSDGGRSWINAENQNITLTEGISALPADSVKLEQPIQESGQVNLKWVIANPSTVDAPYLIALEKNGVIVDTVSASTSTYKDFDVENGKSYTYKLYVYNQKGKYVTSNAVIGKPEIVMVQVTFKVHGPEGTNLNDKITIPNSMNGWDTNAWEMSHNGAVTADWEYTVEVQEGTDITYKYVRGGTWDQEGLPDHTPNITTDDDISLYGYGAIGTDMKITVHNDGGNKMIINDNLFRWIDRPVVITSPLSLTSETTNSSIDFKGIAIKDGILKINNQVVTINADQTFSKNVPLIVGLNTITVSIEPSEQAKNNVFKNDGDAIKKATKTYTYTITRK
ncbi:alpha-amylase family glycosyl hydrolase [Bacillus sp. EAC]|uniref:pullulanase X25 domain-containing protein n=1 Tax=Bacillus sp. EAC TaxID=1978338 RepID=UPI001155151C|nr:alpha-amylase family glycosyl hydrolase [Bacillus sp. EAC]